MFFESLKKMDEMPYKSMLGVAAVLVILCQLVAMALVVNGQMKKAETRDSALELRRIAVAECNEAGAVATRQSCIQQTGDALRLPDRIEPSNQLHAVVIQQAVERADAPVAP